VGVRAGLPWPTRRGGLELGAADHAAGVTKLAHATTACRRCVNLWR
jgi:hypothetical protein